MRHLARLTVTVLVIWLSCSAFASCDENWTRFRGPNGAGVAEDNAKLPTTWDKEENVRWVADIPGWGWGSAIVWGDRVFISSVASEDDYEKPKGGLYNGRGRAEPPNTVHHWMVYCLSLKTGDVIWKHEAHSGIPKAPRHPKSTYAAETPTTDGKRIYVLFGDLGLYCYSLDGKPLWTHQIEPRDTMSDYGAAASPVILNDQVIMTYDNQEDSYIAAINSATGDVTWKVDRDEVTTWGTPLVWKHDGRTEIVQTGRKENRAYSTSGDLLWHFDGKMSVLTIPSPFVVDNLLYLTSGYFQDVKRPVFAIRPNAKGDIALQKGEDSNDAIAWSAQKMGPYNTSPIVYEGKYYTCLDRGMLTCHDAKTGELIFNRTRFPAGASFTASPWAYNGKLFFLSEDGRTFVLTPGDEINEKNSKRLNVVAVNDLEELSIATPSIAGGNLLIRTASKLYCLGR